MEITGTANIYSNEDKKRKKKKREQRVKRKNYVIGKVIGKEGKNIFVKLQKNSQGIVIKNGGQFTIETGLGKIYQSFMQMVKKRERLDIMQLREKIIQEI